MGIGAAVTLEGAARAGEARLPRVIAGWSGPAVALVGVAMAVALVVINLPAADRSQDHSGEAYANGLLAALPPNAVIFSFWGPSAPLWHAQFVLGVRPDVLIVDDTNIVYEGWGTRDVRIASLICSRPIYDITVNEHDVASTRLKYDVVTAMTVRIGSLGPSAQYTLPVYRVTPRPGTCP